METAIIIIFIMIAIYIFLQTPLMYQSELTGLLEERPVTWTYDWGGGHGFSRFQIDKSLVT